MKVINKENTTHTISFIPRFYTENEVTFELKNEFTRDKIIIENIYSITNGVITIFFDYTFTQKDKFQIKINDTENIIYRGKLEVI